MKSSGGGREPGLDAGPGQDADRTRRAGHRGAESAGRHTSGLGFGGSAYWSVVVVDVLSSAAENDRAGRVGCPGLLEGYFHHLEDAWVSGRPHGEAAVTAGKRACGDGFWLSRASG